MITGVWKYRGKSSRWFKHEYLTTKFPPYILKKSNVLPGGTEDANRLIEAFKKSELENKP
ncbi:hypothetical protein ELY04_26115 [Escherichia coli]|nr:hypothetical protein ELY04_26115 [Escherichia coli]